MGDTEVGKLLGLDYQRGDVIILHSHSIDLIKRIVAGPGDEIRLFMGKIYINNKELVEEYLPAGLSTFAYNGDIAFIKENETKTVPADSYFVMGDNRGNSKDSRFTEVGFIKRTDIKGKVLLCYWPLDKFQIFKAGVYLEK